MLDALLWGPVISALISGVAATAANTVAAGVTTLVRERFAGDDEASRDLERARYHPHDPAALRGLDQQLQRHAQDDPQFRQRLLDATEELQAGGVSAHQTLGAADVAGPAFQIGRDNRGGINIGSTSPPAKP